MKKGESTIVQNTMKRTSKDAQKKKPINKTISSYFDRFPREDETIITKYALTGEIRDVINPQQLMEDGYESGRLNMDEILELL